MIIDTFWKAALGGILMVLAMVIFDWFWKKRVGAETNPVIDKKVNRAVWFLLIFALAMVIAISELQRRELLANPSLWYLGALVIFIATAVLTYRKVA